MPGRIQITIILNLCFFNIYSQDITEVHHASDPTWVQSRILIDIGSYIYWQPARFYTASLGYQYGLQNKKHQFAVIVPFAHNLFNADLAGYENTVGIADLKMAYQASFTTGKLLGLIRLSPFVECSAPTGNEILGRGAGTWLYQPGIQLAYHLHPNVSWYPRLAYQFSSHETNTSGGSYGIPNQEDMPSDNLQNFTCELPLTLTMDQAKAWFSLQPVYMYSLTEKEYFLFMTSRAGIMLANKTSGELTISKFVAGLPRLNIIATVRFQFFF